MADESAHIGQDEIERLLAQVKGQSQPSSVPTGPAGEGTLRPEEIAALLGPTASEVAAAPAAPQATARPAPPPQIASGDMEYLLNQAQEALATAAAPAPPPPQAPTATHFKLPQFGGAAPSDECATLELIRDVELDLKIELGRTQMHLEDVLKLRKGAVVPLDKLAGDPVDIYVNGRLIARGEVLVMNDNFCVRVAELVTAEEARRG